MAARGKGRVQRARKRAQPRVSPKPRPTQPDPAADLDAMLAQASAGDVVEVLRSLLESPETPAAARATAARTLAEIEGRIGRFALPPERPTTDAALLTRAELVAELGRLRERCGGGSA